MHMLIPVSVRHMNLSWTMLPNKRSDNPKKPYNERTPTVRVVWLPETHNGNYRNGFRHPRLEPGLFRFLFRFVHLPKACLPRTGLFHLMEFLRRESSRKALVFRLTESFPHLR